MYPLKYLTRLNNLDEVAPLLKKCILLTVPDIITGCPQKAAIIYTAHRLYVQHKI